MGRIFMRGETIARLRATTGAGSPIVAVGASNGIVGKCSEFSGADLIVFGTLGRSRWMGFPTRVIGDFSGNLTMEIQRDLWMVVQNTPLIAGLDANDIESLDRDRLLDRFVQSGVSGVCNLPTIQFYCDQFRGRSKSYLHGFENECELIAKGRQRNLLGVGFVFYPADAEAMVDAGADVIIATCGPTQGGSEGYPPMDMETAALKIGRIADAAKAKNPQVFVLGHGGPFNTPESTRLLYDRTGVDGYFGGSSIERIPVEQAVRDVVSRYKAPVMSKLKAEGGVR
ncbi:MAG: phosphoenolpyruvate hydrolase family protein [Christensenellaceae bacterium]|nr:phosphoenolpyruvate hydrolase family protein [Christensenellaceae bacterium]MEA5067237.1 phosphoenolpyruvate hydrolase family protein [Eubacteriales bacterium]MEA5067653.1 phosphoenolpyruvate hydrolase family protein [Christensenellaceae bacterium]